MQPAAIDPDRFDALLCDADGNLFASEEPAFDASVEVTNRFLATLGIPARFSATELRVATTGKNFRTTAMDLARENGAADAVTPAILERWVAEENRHVSAHLARVLRPDPAVLDAVSDLAVRYTLAAVSSGASSRLAACFEATGLDRLFPGDKRFSAEDSLPAPTSKPDPAIYRFALARLGLEADEALAIEDAAPGARSAVAAGIATIGNVVFVPPEERPARTAELHEAGVVAVVESWEEVRALLVAAGTREPQPAN